jgi:transposase-like protein
MTREAIYRHFPDEGSCVALLEESRWGGGRPKCPKCGSVKTCPMPAEARHHCNGCESSFSVTSRTFMHRTRVERRQWLIALLAATERDRVTVRRLAELVGVTKDTAALMLMRIRHAQVTETEFVGSILQRLLSKVNDDR